MSPQNKKNIFSQMFDVRPVDERGKLDIEKIEGINPVLKIRPKRFFPPSEKKIGEIFYDLKKPDIHCEESRKFARLIEGEKKAVHTDIPVLCDNEPQEKPVSISLDEIKREIATQRESEKTAYFEKFESVKRQKKKKNSLLSQWRMDKMEVSKVNIFRQAFPSFAIACIVIFLAVSSLNLLGRGLKIKNTSLDNGTKAYASLMSAKDTFGSRDYERAKFEFESSYEQFNTISNDVNTLGEVLIKSSKFIPFTSKLSSGAHLALAGKNISKIGIASSEIVSTLEKIKNPLVDDAESISLLKIFRNTDDGLKIIAAESKKLEENLDNINIEDIPLDQREKFIDLKKRLPQANAAIAGFMDNSYIFTDILGGNGPRKYLFLFQNNQEMRPTGGFIGTYGVLDIFDGRVNKFFIDGIFNPDGQLKEKVIPPAPIQKISAAWSLHDSNWFPDFPISAEKACWFYEKTGGPTVDGVITMTPNIIQKMLEITGPIEMPEYGVVIDKDNFIENIQYEVEQNYDKEENKPKKILADLAPKILDAIFNTKDVAQAAKIMAVLSESLSEKHLLIYSKNYKIQKILSERGWSGEILEASKDYLSVINTNINGYKTDGVIDEEIMHSSEIGSDGSITDTVTIKRRHNGGNTPFEWWNKVNADYMRVYVPNGSKLLEASGQTREFNSPPLDYKALGFKSDPQVQMEENSMIVDDESGTRIYKDGGKTVFANWTYVSPGETMEIKYKYLLPFKINVNSKSGNIDSYSVLYQKQSGSNGSKIKSEIIHPDFYQVAWLYPEKNIYHSEKENRIIFEDELKTDKFVGTAFLRK